VTVETPHIDKEYRVTGEIPALCCEGRLAPGEIVRVVRQTSKNRLLVKPRTQGFHRVKRSTFRMNVEEIP
jgi:hypothetical protein